MIRAVVRFARTVARLPSFPSESRTRVQATGAFVEYDEGQEDEEEDDEELIGTVLKVVATDVIPGEVLPNSETTWLAILPFHDLVDKTLSMDAKLERVQVRRAFVELLVRLAESGQFRWDAASMLCGEMIGPERVKTGENAFWIELLRALWPAAARDAGHSLERHLIALTRTRRPRFLLCIDHDVAKLDIVLFLEQFLLPPDDDTDPVLYGPAIVDGLPDDDIWQGIEVEIGLSFTSGKIAPAVMTQLLDLIDRVHANRSNEGMRFRVTTLRFGPLCYLLPKALEVLGHHRQKSPTAVHSIRLGSFLDMRPSYKRIFFTELIRGHACLSRVATSTNDVFVPLASAIRCGGASQVRHVDVRCPPNVDNAAWLAFAFFHVDSRSSVTSLCLRVPRVRDDGHSVMDLGSDWLATFTRVLQSVQAKQDLAHMVGGGALLPNQRQSRTLVRLHPNIVAKTSPMSYSKGLGTLGDTAHDEFELLVRHKHSVALVVPGAGIGWVPSYAIASERSVPSVLQASDHVAINHRITSFTWDGCMPRGDTTSYIQVVLGLLAIIGAPLKCLHLPGLSVRSKHLAQIISSCPNLTELNVSGHELEDIEPLEQAFATGRCKITKLSIARVVYKPTGEGHLTHAMTRILQGNGRHTLRQLVMHTLPPTQRVELEWDRNIVPFANVVSASAQLNYLHLPGLNLFANGALQRLPVDFSTQPLGFTPMPLRAKLAFLSVISRYSTDRSLGRLDASVLGVIFRFSYDCVARRVLKDAPLVIHQCVCKHCTHRPQGHVK